MTETTSMTKKSKKSSAPKLFPDELIDQLLAQVQNKDAESILGESGLAGLLKKQLAERMLAAELTHHLASEAKQGKSGNHRNGSSPKTVITPNGELELDIPRDRQTTFEPQLVAQFHRRAKAAPPQPSKAVTLEGYILEASDDLLRVRAGLQSVLTLLGLQAGDIPDSIGLHALLSPLKQQIDRNADRLQALV
jgi:hypothetical protein